MLTGGRRQRGGGTCVRLSASADTLGRSDLPRRSAVSDETGVDQSGGTDRLHVSHSATGPTCSILNGNNERHPDTTSERRRQLPRRPSVWFCRGSARTGIPRPAWFRSGRFGSDEAQEARLTSHRFVRQRVPKPPFFLVEGQPLGSLVLPRPKSPRHETKKACGNAGL